MKQIHERNLSFDKSLLEPKNINDPRMLVEYYSYIDEKLETLYSTVEECDNYARDKHTFGFW
jgi:coproporphyrinogen III oxidase-like Fe-S oxidoreductase